MKKHLLFRSSQAKRALAVTTAFLASTQAFALNQIIRPFQSARVAGMGGVRYTTGLYEENFFNNPARVTANPKFKFTLLDAMIEGNSNLPSTISNLTGEGDVVTNLAETAGDNNHARIQTTFPAIYFAPGAEGRWGVAFALITSTQTDVALRNNYDVSPQAITDIGPTLTVGRKFLEDKSLSVGMSTHFAYRLASDTNYSLIKLIQGESLSPLETGGQGAMIDFDLGATYDLPVELGGFKPSVAFAIDNLLGGNYSNINLELVDQIINLPYRQPRTFNFGFSMLRPTWGAWSNTVFALEFTDIGNNPDGGFFRLVHLGMETNWKVIALRAGLNQGYLCAGVGFNLRFFTLDLSTYGEEMALNPGYQQDRRYAAKIAFQIQ